MIVELVDLGRLSFQMVDVGFGEVFVEVLDVFVGIDGCLRGEKIGKINFSKNFPTFLHFMLLNNEVDTFAMFNRGDGEGKREQGSERRGV